MSHTTKPTPEPHAETTVTTEDDIERLKDRGIISTEMAKLMMSSIRKGRTTTKPTPEPHAETLSQQKMILKDSKIAVSYRQRWQSS